MINQNVLIKLKIVRHIMILTLIALNVKTDMLLLEMIEIIVMILLIKKNIIL